MKKSCYAPWAVLLLTGLIGLSCSRLDEIPQSETPETPEKTMYTLIIKAEKEASTKALEDMGTTLKSTWTAGEEVTVYGPGDQILGTLTASTGGSSTTTLEGDLNEAPEVGADLTLKYRSNNYLTQKGTLDYIAANCDYALATVRVETVTEKHITTTPALFETQQAIVKFTLQDADGNAVAASQLLLNNGGTTYTVNLDSASSTVYVAIPAFSNQTVTLSATAGTSYYDLSKADVTFENGKFYTITAQLRKQPVSSITMDGGAVKFLYGGTPASEAL